MTKPDDDAFPVNMTRGMTIREWYAGQAVIGLVMVHNPTVAAEIAVKIADALIARLNAPTKPSRPRTVVEEPTIDPYLS